MEMTREELFNAIKAKEAELNALRQELLNTAKFKVGDKVVCMGKGGFIAKTNTGTFSPIFFYQINLPKKDGTIGKRVLAYYANESKITHAD